MQWIPPLNAQRVNPKSPVGIVKCLDVLQRFGANPAHIATLKASPLLQDMPMPQIRYYTDESTNSGILKGATFNLEMSLLKIGFSKTEASIWTIGFDDDENTREFVLDHLQTLANVKGWSLMIDK